MSLSMQPSVTRDLPQEPAVASVPKEVPIVPGDNPWEFAVRRGLVKCDLESPSVAQLPSGMPVSPTADSYLDAMKGPPDSRQQWIQDNTNPDGFVDLRPQPGGPKLGGG